jgi:hypothetical protein
VSRLSRQCRILNISQPYRPPQPVTGIALLLYFIYLISVAKEPRILACNWWNMFLSLNFSHKNNSWSGRPSFQTSRVAQKGVIKSNVYVPRFYVPISDISAAKCLDNLHITLQLLLIIIKFWSRSNVIPGIRWKKLTVAALFNLLFWSWWQRWDLELGTQFQLWYNNQPMEWHE